MFTRRAVVVKRDMFSPGRVFFFFQKFFGFTYGIRIKRTSSAM